MGAASRISYPEREVIADAVKGTLWIAISACAMAGPLYAADNSPVEEVIVTGQRQSIQTAQEIKQNAEQFVDAIAAVDIGALPDRTVTEALQRIPGITIDRMFAPNDTNRFSAEGSGVLIRGLTQVRSELNGRDVFSARNTRALSFDDVPAELMSGVEVYKNPSADLIEGGIAGTVNLRTRKPFDSADRVLGLSASANYGDFIEQTKPQASLIYSDRWQTGIGEIGALVNVAYAQLATRTDSIQYGRPFRRRASDVGATDAESEANCVDMSGGPSFSCVYIPQGVRWSELDFERERMGYSLAFQWRPNDTTEVYVQALRSDYTMNWIEHSAWFQDWAYNLKPAPGTSFTYGPGGVFQRGEIISDNGRGGIVTGSTTRAAETNQITTDYSLGFTFRPTERLAVNAEVQYVDASADNTDFTINSASVPSSLTLDLTGSLPRVTLPASYAADPSNYYWAAAMDGTQANSGREFATRFDVQYEIDSGWFKSAKVGARYADRNAINRDTGFNWAPLTETWNGAPQLNRLDSVIADQAVFVKFDNFYRGKTPLPSGIWVARNSLAENLISDAATVRSAGAGDWYWEPDHFREGDINDQQEQTLAGFAVLRFGGDLGSTVLDGNIGTRVVRTESNASGFVQQPDLTESTYIDRDLVARIGTGQWLPVEQEGSYTDVLPSLNLRLRITPEFIVRAAVSKAIARPSFDQLRANVKLGTTILNVNDANGMLIDQVITAFTGDGGNPWLKPMQAKQYDGAVEWYFAPSGSLTSTVFYKDVKNYFLTGTSVQNLFGQDWEVKSTINGEQGVIKGVEFGYSQFYDRLPGLFRGLGFQANFTYVDSKGSPGPTAGELTVPGNLPLEGLSKTSYNLIGMYQLGPIEARLAYNWRERWLLTTVDGDQKGTVWNDDFGQLDGSVFYRVNDRLQVGIEANNLTNTTQKLLVGPYKYAAGDPAYNAGYIDNRLYQNAWFTYDRRFAVTARMTF